MTKLKIVTVKEIAQMMGVSQKKASQVKAEIREHFDIKRKYLIEKDLENYFEVTRGTG